MANKKSQQDQQSKQESKKSNSNVRFVGDPVDIKDVYADGIAGVMGRGEIIKLQCYRVLGVDNESGQEIRQIVNQVILPLSAVPELIKVIEGVVEKAKDAAELRRSKDK